MFKKTTIIIFISSFLLMDLSMIFPAKAEETLVEQPLPPSSKALESVLDQAPEIFDMLDEGEVMACVAGNYENYNSWFLPALTVMFNPTCQNLGRIEMAFGSGGTLAAGTCMINVGGVDLARECKDWVQKKKATAKAKVAEITKLALRSAVKYFMDRLVSSTVDWISGRTTGKPQFVTNWRAFFGEVANEAFGLFIENSPFSDLCEPFRFSVRLRTQLPGQPPFPRCTLSMVVNNIESFYDNFANGGWLAFEESYYPWNDAFGAWMMTQEAAEAELAAAKEEAEKKTQSGFEPTEYCVETKRDPATGQDVCVKKVVSIPGETKADITSKALTNQMEKSDSYFLTSDDLEGYGKMIAQAIITRLIKSAKELLIGGKWYGKGLLDLPAEGNKGPSLNLRYTCKNYNGARTCEPDSNGAYSSLESCEAVCSGFSARYRCDTQSHVCVRDDSGNYSDYLSCAKNCQSSTSTPSLEGRYSCSDEGLCIPDANGEFTSMASCTKYCHPQTEEGKSGVTPPSY
jgi:hypothetical protein